ncbi:cytochrome b561 domain-containing protein At4g18260-like [Coffea eugenioides]|uniref:Cytochrome b561 domain-containing protein At4g18260 n=1 Tax=Coffea arabica TaxID=13443 RepID=A0A6P6UBR1_COFAR|nr:cytochrome b561 domain-containing protein At4g18260-like isoform X1 [Coffea arabica]XP_027154953.1 cytochrome b561 domain-containing protein At4g18260-like [Coffea eugenioides]
MHRHAMIFYCCICASFALHLLPCVKCSSIELKPASDNSIKHHQDSQKTFYIAVHGILLWVSMGFLMPVGILVIRMASAQEFHRTTLKVFFYLHAIAQVLSVLLATAGAVISIRSFENSFNNCHQRLGLGLYGAIYVQILTGFRRPRRGRKSRSVWYLFHWIMGTAISFVGVFNTYTGLKAYHSKTSKSTSLWTALFTAQVLVMAFFYLFQDKWDYMKKQGVILGNEPITTSSVQIITQGGNDKDSSTTEPCRKSNSLGTYFSRSNALNKLFQLT